MPSLNQEVLINNFKKYYEIQKASFPDKYTDEADEFIGKISYGICSGLTSVWFLFAHLNKEEEFIELMEKISSWDGRAESLSKDLEKDINYFFSMANFLQHGTETGAESFSHKEEILQNLSVISDHEIEKNIFTAFNANKEQLKSFLASLLKDGTFAHISGSNHVIGIYKKGDRYFFYDPNNPEGIVSGSLDELSDSIFHSVAAPAGYKDGDIATINLTTYENREKLDDRKMTLEEISSLHEAAGFYSETNRYSSKKYASPFYLFALNNDIDAIKELLSKSPINLFNKFSRLDHKYKQLEQRHASYLLHSPIMAEHFADIIRMSAPSREEQRIKFIQENIHFLIGRFSEEQISMTIESLNLTEGGRTFVFNYIVNGLGMKEYFHLLKHLSINQDKMNKIAANSTFSDSYIELIKMGLVDPNCVVEGFPFIHHCKISSAVYPELVKLGANQFQRSASGDLAIDYYLDEFFMDKLEAIQELGAELSTQEYEPMMKDLITALFMSRHFLEDIEIRTMIISKLKQSPYEQQANILSSLLSRDDIQPKTIDAIVSSCKENHLMLGIISKEIDKKGNMADLSEDSAATLSECRAYKKAMLQRFSMDKENIQPKSASAPASKRKRLTSESESAPAEKTRKPFLRSRD